MSRDSVSLFTAFRPPLETLEGLVRKELGVATVDEVVLLFEFDGPRTVWCTTFWVDNDVRAKLAVAPIAIELSRQGLVLLAGSFPHASLWETRLYDGGQLLESDEGDAALARGWTRVFGRSSVDRFDRDDWLAYRVSLDELGSSPQVEHPFDRGLQPSILLEHTEPSPADDAWELGLEAAVQRYERFWGLDTETREARQTSGLSKIIAEFFPVRVGHWSLEVDDYDLSNARSKHPFLQEVVLIFRVVKWQLDEPIKVLDVIENSCSAFPRVVAVNGQFHDREGRAKFITDALQDHTELRAREWLQEAAQRATQRLEQQLVTTPNPLWLIGRDAANITT